LKDLPFIKVLAVQQHVIDEFMYVELGEISRNEDGDLNLIAIKGTRLVHCVRSIGKPGNILTRDYRCYCTHCIQDNESIAYQ
jgi:hypothetical protein